MKDMHKLIITLTVIAIIFIVTIINVSTQTIDNEPISKLFWIDNNRVHIDSIIDCNPIYNDSLEVIGSWIRVSYGQTVIHIECVDTDDYVWEEFHESWLMAFNERLREYL